MLSTGDTDKNIELLRLGLSTYNFIVVISFGKVVDANVDKVSSNVKNLMLVVVMLLLNRELI